MAGSGLDIDLVVSVAITSSAGFTRGPTASCIYRLVLLAEAELRRDFSRDRGEAESARGYAVMLGVVGIAVRVVCYGVRGRVGSI
jgi:hypothetical protein